MLEELNLQKLNELKLCISTSDVRIEVEWFHATRRDNFFNPKWHMHPSVEMHCVLEGKDEFYFQDNEAVMIHSGQGILIPPKMIHKRIQQPQNEKLLKFSLNFSITPLSDSEESKFLYSAFNSDSFRLLVFPEDAQRMMIHCLKEANERKFGFLMVISSSLQSALVMLARELSQDPDADYPVPLNRGINDERYQILEKYIQSNLNNQISVSSVADYMNLSAKQLGRIVTESSDYSSVQDMILSLRMKKAKELLRQPELSNADIARMIGFSSEYYFNRIFRQKIGLPPGRYRKSLRAN